MRTESSHDVLSAAEPEDVGLSSDRLRILDETLTAEVAAGRLSGAVVAIARGGRLAHLRAVGYRDPAAGVPMTTDTLFWLASMTKPITTAGALTLYEQGSLLLTDPLAAHLPEFADQRVAVVDPATDTVTLVDPARPPQLHDLLRHTSGIVEGTLGATPVHRLYADAVGDGPADRTGQEFIDRLARVPLLHQPGAEWHYGWGLDLTGLIIERITGATLETFLRERILDPLGMHDTTFVVPEGRSDRLAPPLPHDPARARFDSGGAGLFGTATDYLRFAQMLLGAGQFGTTRVLARKTAELMTSEQLGPETDTRGLETMADWSRGHGFGLGLAVRRPAGAPAAGSPGELMWPGVSGTYWWADPREDLAAVFLAHTEDRATKARHFQLFRALTLQSLR
ncbi:beta-lactamase family protein [Nocardia sp. CDC159]|uniref:Beta-lactamase family protein n=1 Tax=Nocardia pulmonis TaxID=2951408 RepID=A0A9X2E497_9NOCA|nr:MULTISPECIES: serine hydrolase domain-containing protein [Nocardia]MCM6773852.1 beta-lactamase family protein [Nocardia pulmonis]MCM6786739.1 beta-lactamase family protein [Nocardia sp. CDC159]